MIRKICKLVLNPGLFRSFSKEPPLQDPEELTETDSEPSEEEELEVDLKIEEETEGYFKLFRDWFPGDKLGLLEIQRCQTAESLISFYHQRKEEFTRTHFAVFFEVMHRIIKEEREGNPIRLFIELRNADFMKECLKNTATMPIEGKPTWIVKGNFLFGRKQTVFRSF